MDEKAKLILGATLDERAGLRREIIELDKSIVKCSLAFLAVAMAVVGILFGDIVVNHIPWRNTLLLMLTQVLYFISLLVLSILSNVNCHAAYIESLETRINQLCGECVSIWESGVVRQFMTKPKGTMYQIIIAICALLAIVNGIIIVLALETLDSFIYGAVFTVEVASAGFFVFRMLSERDRVRKFSDEHLTGSSICDY